MTTALSFAAHTRVKHTRGGDFRASFQPHVVQLASQVLLGHFLSEAVVASRLEATAAYEATKQDAIDTSEFMFAAALRNPASLLHERDLPAGFEPSLLQRTNFIALLRAQEESRT